jgi:N-glycosylase/DNA lyase
MIELISKIEQLKQTNISSIINNRINDFKKVNKKSKNEIFSELCFCILTANFNAEKCINIQKEIGDKFSNISEKELAKELTRLGHRFPNHRAKYIIDSTKHHEILNEVVCNSKDTEIREWLVKNIKGLGYKESSHFLRNIGFDNLAIIDFHIIDLLVSHDLIRKPKSINKNKYLEIENILKKIGKETNLTLAELDLYLWYIETGKILK